MSWATFADVHGTFLDALPDAAAVLDANGTIVAVNAAWTRFAKDNGGDPALAGPGVDYLSVCDDGTAGIRRGIRAVLDGVDHRYSIEYPCHTPRAERWFRLTVTPLLDGALVVHSDITAEFTRISRWLSATDIAIIQLAPDLSPKFVNDSWRRIVGRGAWTDAIHPDDVDTLYRQLAHCLMDRRPFSTEVRVGSGWFRMAAHLELAADDAVAAVVLVGIDISVESASIARRAATEERHRLAAELHDTVVQRLYATALVLQRETQGGAADAEVLEETITRLDQSIADLRAINRPDPAVPEDLLEAIDNVLADAEAALGFRLTATVDLGSQPLSATVVTNLLPVLTEALSNVARHAQATTCRVRLIVTDDRLVLTVADNGRGMPARRTRSSGTANIRRRAEELGGRPIWSSNPGGGTVLTWQIQRTAPSGRPATVGDALPTGAPPSAAGTPA